MMIIPFLRLLRPHQWVKNLLLLFPPFFAGKMFDMTVVSAVIPVLVSFSLAASCSYIINDIKDVNADKNHSVKKKRVIAQGIISPRIAVFVAVLLYVFAILVSASVSRRFEWFLIVYLFTSLAYTFFFKDIVIVDIFFISFGFLIRVVAGGEAFGIPASNWLFLTVFTVSLLLAAGKRFGELISLGEHALKHRKSLIEYSSSFLEGILWFSGASALVTYALYTIEHKNALFYTVPLAAFGLLRYIYIVKQGKGDPTEALLLDNTILGVGLLWVILVGAIIYSG